MSSACAARALRILLDEHPPPRLGQDPSGNAVTAAREMFRCARHRKLPTLLRRQHAPYNG